MDAMHEIRSLIVRQKIVGDEQDEAATRDCWSADACLNVRVNDNEAHEMIGREQVMAFTKRAWETDAHGSRDEPHVHFGGPAEITMLSDERARVRSTCLYVGPGAGGQIVIHGYGRYDDDVVLEDGRWKLRHRRLRITHPGIQ